MNRYSLALDQLKSEDNYRSLPNLSEDNIIDLSSNDYLSINSDEKIHADFLKTIKYKSHKFGSTSPRLLLSHTNVHRELEQIIASSYNTQESILYNSGCNANIGVLSALGGKKDLIIGDRLIHASLIDGIKLGEAKFMRYRHLDYAHLESLLEKHRADYDNVIIVSESIFSMDGDMADLQKLVDIKYKYNSLLFVDEAHALGVRGKNGYGCVEEFDVMKDVDFIVGTFGKSVASLGSFVACSSLFKNFLINYSRPFIFTTALPPINVEWTKYILQKLPDFYEQRENLKILSKKMAEMINPSAETHIIPFVIGENKTTVLESQHLLKHGFNVLPIRYPTVPKNSARLRFSLNANMCFNDLLPIKNLLKKYE